MLLNIIYDCIFIVFKCKIIWLIVGEEGFLRCILCCFVLWIKVFLYVFDFRNIVLVEVVYRLEFDWFFVCYNIGCSVL